MPESRGRPALWSFFWERRGLGGDKLRDSQQFAFYRKKWVFLPQILPALIKLIPPKILGTHRGIPYEKNLFLMTTVKFVHYVFPSNIFFAHKHIQEIKQICTFPDNFFFAFCFCYFFSFFFDFFPNTLII